MKRILLDIDGVIADFTGHLLTHLRTEGHGRRADGSPMTDDDLFTWELKACFPAESHKAIERIMTRPGFFAGIPRYPGAQLFYRKLRQLGEVVAVTTVKGRAQQERYDWLVSMGFNDRDIVLVEEHAHKIAVPGDAIIEDRIETLRACPHRVKILLDRPWNQGSTPGVARVTSYRHVLAHLEAAGIK